MLNEPTQVTSLRWKGHFLVHSLITTDSVSKSEAFLQGQWVSIEPPDTSTGVLFAGDMLERITNGKAGRTHPKPRVGLGTFLVNPRSSMVGTIPWYFTRFFPWKSMVFSRWDFSFWDRLVSGASKLLVCTGRVNGFTVSLTCCAWLKFCNLFFFG